MGRHPLLGEMILAGTPDPATGTGAGPQTGDVVGPRKAKPAADAAVIDTLFEEFSVAGGPIEGRLRILIDEMQQGNVPEKYGRDIVHLIADALSGLQVSGVAAAGRAADIGSGYGFPGLVLAAALTDTEFTLLELDPVRSDFLRNTSEKMGLTNVSVVNWPVEDWRDGIGQFDFVTARNVALLPTVVEWSAPLLKVGGSALLWARARDEVEEKNGKAAADATGMRPGEVLRLSTKLLGADTDRRHIHVYIKQSETPPGFPRRRKAALKDPIMARTGFRRNTRWDEAVRKRTMYEERKQQSTARKQGRGKNKKPTRPLHKRAVKAIRRVLVRVKGPRDRPGA
jgi:16S rRNA (guanine527-N7)-methyltransferase